MPFHRLSSTTGEYRGCAVEFRRVIELESIDDPRVPGVFRDACLMCFDIIRLSQFPYQDVAQEMNRMRKS